jgi:uncharacterized Ntn-hydrolase superfamily protein
MAQAWEDCADRLPFMPRLVTALLAGDEAGGDRRGRQSAALRVWRWDPSHEPTAIDSVADLRIDDAEYPVHDLMQMLPRLWLEYGRADKERSLLLEGEIRARVAGRLRAPPAEAEPALEGWARDRNLESRLLEGRIDPTVLDVLERGVDEVLAQVGEQVPRQFWPD